MTAWIQLKHTTSVCLTALLLTGFAIAQSAQANNVQIIRIDERTPVLNCCPERVDFGGTVQVRFGVNGRGDLVPEQIQIERAGGIGISTGRRYHPAERSLRALDLRTEICSPTQSCGTFKFRFKMEGRPNPSNNADPNPGTTFFFLVEYRIRYTFNGRAGLLDFIPTGPFISCTILP